MRYAIEVVDGVELMSGSSPLPEGAITPVSNWEDLIELPYYYRKITDGVVVEKTEAEKVVYDQAHPPTVEELQYEALRHLVYTDWLAARKIDTGRPIPQDIQDSRQSARDIL